MFHVPKTRFKAKYINSNTDCPNVRQEDKGTIQTAAFYSDSLSVLPFISLLEHKLEASWKESFARWDRNMITPLNNAKFTSV